MGRCCLIVKMPGEFTTYVVPNSLLPEMMHLLLRHGAESVTVEFRK